MLKDCEVISIHALRKEGDDQATDHVAVRFAISIHALRKEGDSWDDGEKVGHVIFQSTPSVKRATRRALR